MVGSDSHHSPADDCSTRSGACLAHFSGAVGGVALYPAVGQRRFSIQKGTCVVCLFFSTLLFGPRFAIILWWLFDPSRWSSAFSTFIFPVLGFIFLPWTTLMFVAVAPLGHVTGFDWVWLGLAVGVDIMIDAGGGYRNRNRMPGYGGY
jgi:hypothetical protein